MYSQRYTEWRETRKKSDGGGGWMVACNLCHLILSTFTKYIIKFISSGIEVIAFPYNQTYTIFYYVVFILQTHIHPYKYCIIAV